MGRSVGRSALLVAVLLATGCSTRQLTLIDKGEDDGEIVRNAEVAAVKQHVVTQSASVWCWAACAEMVHRMHGNGRTEWTQARLAEHLTGVRIDDTSAVPKPVGLRGVMVALYPEHQGRFTQRQQALFRDNPSAEINYGPVLTAAQSAWQASSDDLVDAILAGEPVVAGLRSGNSRQGHAVVIYAVEYRFTRPARVLSTEPDDPKALADGFAQFGSTLGDTFRPSAYFKYRVRSVRYIDPMDGKTYELAGKDLAKQIDFFVDAPRARLLLDREMLAFEPNGADRLKQLTDRDRAEWQADLDRHRQRRTEAR